MSGVSPFLSFNQSEELSSGTANFSRILNEEELSGRRT